MSLAGTDMLRTDAGRCQSEGLRRAKTAIQISIALSMALRAHPPVRCLLSSVRYCLLYRVRMQPSRAVYPVVWSDGGLVASRCHEERGGYGFLRSLHECCACAGDMLFWRFLRKRWRLLGMCCRFVRPSISLGRCLTKSLSVRSYMNGYVCPRNWCGTPYNDIATGCHNREYSAEVR